MHAFGFELKTVGELISKLDDYIKAGKPRWKKMWEKEVQDIVSEQKVMKEQEKSVGDYDDLQHDLSDFFVQLSKVRPRNPGDRVTAVAPVAHPSGVSRRMRTGRAAAGEPKTAGAALCPARRRSVQRGPRPARAGRHISQMPDTRWGRSTGLEISLKDRKDSMLTAIKAQSADASKRRLEAMAAAEKVRSRQRSWTRLGLIP